MNAYLYKCSKCSHPMQWEGAAHDKPDCLACTRCGHLAYATFQKETVPVLIGLQEDAPPPAHAPRSGCCAWHAAQFVSSSCEESRTGQGKPAGPQ